MKTLKWLILLFIPGMLSLPGCKPDNEPGQTQEEYLFAKKTTYRVFLPNAKFLPPESHIVFEKDAFVIGTPDKLKQFTTLDKVDITDKSNFIASGRQTQPRPPNPCKTPGQCPPPREVELMYDAATNTLSVREFDYNTSSQYTVTMGPGNAQDFNQAVRCSLY